MSTPEDAALSCRLDSHARPCRRSAAFALLLLMAASLLPVQLLRADMVFQVLHELDPAGGGVAWPSGPLVEAEDGSFYGTTVVGGDFALGAIFRFSPSDSLTPLVSFADENGSYPSGGLVVGEDGHLYGVTGSGGSSFHGTVFQATFDGLLTSLVSFEHSNGSGPRGPLVRASNGSFYGVTTFGGDYDEGTIYQLMPDGALTTWVHFDGTNGSNPSAGLAKGNDGSFYGTTAFGGPNWTGYLSGHGTVFKMTPEGVLTTLVHFDGTNGSRPQCVLQFDDDGNIYGSTMLGGDFGWGTIFRISPAGELQTLFSFDGSNGANPSGVIRDAHGNMYGTTAYRVGDAPQSEGTLFMLGTNGGLTTLVHFDGTIVHHPYAYFVQGSDGIIYGAIIDVERKLSSKGTAGLIFRLVQRPRFSSITLSEGAVTLTWVSLPDRRYRLESAHVLNPADWTVVEPEIIASGPTTDFTLSVGDDPSYFRVILLQLPVS